VPDHAVETEREREPGVELMELLSASYSRMTRLMSCELERRCGIPLSWYEVLIQLGCANGSRLTMTQLASQISLTSGGVTRLIDRIAEAGLVERQNCPSDRRSVYVAITDEGRTTLETASTTYSSTVDRYLTAPLGADECKRISESLRRLSG
jgi:DNA-binding MarR family transcriptional regulator